MPARVHVHAAAIALLLAPPALATEYTDLPRALSGTVGLSYGGFSEWGALEEGNVQIAQRRVVRHDIDYVFEFSPIEGIAGVIDISHTPSLRYAYPNALRMVTEPVEGGGTYLLSDEAGDTVEVTGSGLNGVWLGVALAPFSEHYQQAHPSTWRIDLAFRTGNPNHNLWSAAPDGKRGTAPGGTALRVTSAFSSSMGTGNPWLRVGYEKENRVEGLKVVDDTGASHGTIDVSPASNFEVRGGLEVEGVDDAETHTRFAVDLSLGFGYHTWEDVASGVYLPEPIDAGRRVPVTAGDYVYVRTGLAFDLQMNAFLRARTGPELRFHTPFRPEHLYDVSTAPEHIGLGWVFTLQGMIDVSGGDG